MLLIFLFLQPSYDPFYFKNTPAFHFTVSLFNIPFNHKATKILKLTFQRITDSDEESIRMNPTTEQDSLVDSLGKMKASIRQI